MKRCLSAQRRTSAAALAAAAAAVRTAERSTHTHSHTHEEQRGERSKSQSRGKHVGPTGTADLAGPLQEAAGVSDDSQVCTTVFSVTMSGRHGAAEDAASG